jgi:hypothetical protein
MSFEKILLFCWLRRRALYVFAMKGFRISHRGGAEDAEKKD